LRITADALVPEGSFAEAQAAYLSPNPDDVALLSRLCRDKKVGLVAHFYMDAELQGVIAALDWEHKLVSDSLQMADAAVRMVEGGCEVIVVLGVDFMSENVRAVLDHAGHRGVRVYRVSPDPIGCSLAASADAPAYDAWLRQAAATPSSLHVVYINTSLATKARAQALVPTITCTSSNVVQTILQAASQIPGVHVWYGPDTYMGHNLQTLLTQVSGMSDPEIRTLHPDHDRASVLALLGRFHVFEQGACVVHHLFGDEVTEQVRRAHPDALLTAHLEVPGEMFALAARAQAEDRGVVGSTSNILSFITRKVDAAAERRGDQTVEVVLGTEAGMITSIVRNVQKSLRSHARDDIAVDVVFPVAAEAVSSTEDPLGLVPGVPGGEGCSPAGGCATCPYMKMNSLDALLRVLEDVGTPREPTLAAFRPRRVAGEIAGRTAADLGSEPILHMRAFQRTGRLPDALVTDVLTRHTKTGAAPDVVG
jgi:quinolinate synthase